MTHEELDAYERDLHSGNLDLTSLAERLIVALRDAWAERDEIQAAFDRDSELIRGLNKETQFQGMAGEAFGRAAEREECAKLAEEIGNRMLVDKYSDQHTAQHVGWAIRNAIRARDGHDGS